MIEQLAAAPQNDTAIMLDQLWRIVAYAVIQGFCFALGMYPVLRYAWRKV